MKPNFNALLSQYVAPAFAKQLAFADVIGERGWALDLGKGRVFFGDDLSYPIQLVGTESDGDESWLWAWANEGSNLPPELLEKCLELRCFGEEHDIEEFTQRGFRQDLASGHDLALVASGMNAGSCYYRGPYDGGALYFLIQDVPEEITLPFPVERVVTVINEVVSQFDVDHREMVKSLFASQGFEVVDEPELITGSRHDGTLRLSIGESGRISKLVGELAQKNAD